MEVEDAAGGDGDVAGTAAPQARFGREWNKHDDAAVAGILAAARAAGASGASVRYGGVVTKIWFDAASGTDSDMVKEKTKELQLATAQTRIDELERRAAGDSKRAQKEKERKKKQKAAKKAAEGQEEQQRGQKRAAVPASSNEAAAAQQLAHAARQHSTGPGSPAAAQDVVASGGCRRTAQQQQPGASIYGAAPTAAMQIDSAGAGSSRSAAAFGPPVARGTPAAGPQQPSSLFGTSRPASNWMAHGTPGAAFGQQPGVQQ